MQSVPTIARDETAREIYTRAQQPYWNLLRQAEQERLLRAAGIGARRGSRLLLALGSVLIAVGSRLREIGCETPAQNRGC